MMDKEYRDTVNYFITHIVGLDWDVKERPTGRPINMNCKMNDSVITLQVVPEDEQDVELFVSGKELILNEGNKSFLNRFAVKYAHDDVKERHCEAIKRAMGDLFPKEVEEEPVSDGVELGEEAIEAFV